MPKVDVEWLALQGNIGLEIEGIEGSDPSQDSYSNRPLHFW